MEVLNPYTFKGAGGTNPIDTRNYYAQTDTPTTEYSISVFINYFPEFNDLFYLKGELIANNRYATIFELYFNVAKGIFSTEVYQDMASYCISLLIAHRLQLAIGRTKNTDNVANLNSSNSSATNKEDKGGKTITKSDLEKTDYGKELAPIMKALGQMRAKGVY